MHSQEIEIIYQQWRLNTDDNIGLLTLLGELRDGDAASTSPVLHELLPKLLDDLGSRARRVGYGQMGLLMKLLLNKDNWRALIKTESTNALLACFCVDYIRRFNDGAENLIDTRFYPMLEQWTGTLVEQGSTVEQRTKAVYLALYGEARAALDAEFLLDWSLSAAAFTHELTQIRKPIKVLPPDHAQTLALPDTLTP